MGLTPLCFRWKKRVSNRIEYIFLFKAPQIIFEKNDGYFVCKPSKTIIGNAVTVLSDVHRKQGGG